MVQVPQRDTGAGAWRSPQNMALQPKLDASPPTSHHTRDSPSQPERGPTPETLPGRSSRGDTAHQPRSKTSPLHPTPHRLVPRPCGFTLQNHTHCSLLACTHGGSLPATLNCQGTSGAPPTGYPRASGSATLDNLRIPAGLLWLSRQAKAYQ